MGVARANFQRTKFARLEPRPRPAHEARRWGRHLRPRLGHANRHSAARVFRVNCKRGSAEKMLANPPPWPNDTCRVAAPV
eukprot:scaffold8770_cov62-Phaeocystis_antarctica.AAC.6